MPSIALAFDVLARDKQASQTLEDIGDTADRTGGKLTDLSGVGKVAFGDMVARFGEDPAELRVYPCSWCGRWHVGHVSQEVLAHRARGKR